MDLVLREAIIYSRTLSKRRIKAWEMWISDRDIDDSVEK